MKQAYTIPRNQLDGVDAFMRVAERRSFTAAAEDLGVTPSAVSQTVRALEERIGVPLLTRTTRSVGLTQAGELFLARARPAFSDLTADIDAARNLGERPAGLLRINLPRAAIPIMIEPILPGFLDAYPEIEVDLCAEDGLVDIITGGFDCGIRLGEHLQADMVALRLTSPFDIVVAGAPGYFERFGRPETIGDLAQHRCLRSRQPTSGAIGNWTFNVNGRMTEFTPAGPFITNDYTTYVSAMVAGIGLGWAGAPTIANLAAAGQLETVLDAFRFNTPGVFLYYPSRAQMLPKLRAFIDYFRSQDVARIMLDPATMAIAPRAH